MWAAGRGDASRFQGVHTWTAYDRVSGEVVGRGGPSRPPVDDDWGQLYAFLPDERRCVPPVRGTCELAGDQLGAAPQVCGLGYATQIGRAARVRVRRARGPGGRRDHDAPRRWLGAVMERLGMHAVGEIRTRGVVEGVGVRDDAPYAACVLLNEEWNPS